MLDVVDPGSSVTVRVVSTGPTFGHAVYTVRAWTALYIFGKESLITVIYDHFETYTFLYVC